MIHLVETEASGQYMITQSTNIFEEQDGSDTLRQWFAYGNYIDEVLLKAYPNDSPLAYIHDHLYSPVALLEFDEDGVVERYEYDAYGNPYIFTSSDGQWFDGDDSYGDYSSYGNPFLFTGREFDCLDEANLRIQYNRNRYYDYYTGRWLTQDPAGYVDGLNLYGYVKNNPVFYVDPYGFVFCMGGKWWTAGSLYVGGLSIISVSNAHLSLVCQKGRIWGKFQYLDECKQVVFEQKVYHVPYALIRVVKVGVASAWGWGYYLVSGSISGVVDSSELGWGIEGPGAGLSAVISVYVSGDKDNGERAWGLTPGLGVSVDIIGLSRSSVMGEGESIRMDKLPISVAKLYNEGFYDRDFKEDPSKYWEDLPIEFMPLPKPGGFEQ